MKKIIRTPESRFDNLPGYYFKSNYLEIEEGLRMHYVDEGQKDLPIILLLHGEPSWSYLYRHMIPVLVENNFRVIAPDLVGFGKSDKYVERSEYSYQKHIEWMSAFIRLLNLNKILLFCQDWGGLIGLRLLTEMGDRFSMAIASNTSLPTGKIPMPDVFLKWREFSQTSPAFDIGKVIEMGITTQLSDETLAAYNAPFPSEAFKAGARIFPSLVPINPDDPESKNNVAAWEKLSQWTKPFLTIFGEKDYITKGAEKAFNKLIPGAAGQNHAIIEAGHFIQEEKGKELSNMIVEFYKKNIS